MARAIQAYDPKPGAWGIVRDAEVRCFGARPLPDRRGDAGEVLEVGEIGHVGVDPCEASRHAGRDPMIERAASTQHRPDELLHPAAVARLERGGAAVEGGVEEHTGPEVGE
ncbi:MAG: hypothetical protein ACKORK_14400 [Gemmatimonadota bacterium]